MNWTYWKHRLADEVGEMIGLFRDIWRDFKDR